MNVRGKLIEADLRLLRGLPLAAPSAPDLPTALATCTGEHAFQESLSRHSEYLPHLAHTHHGVWFDWVLYKLRLPSGNEVDFAFVETTSALTTVVLIEIEDPAKAMWVGSLQKPAKSADFSRAIEQVSRWRTDLRDPQQLLSLREFVRKLLGGSGLVQNGIEVQYGLVYGRSAENSSDERRAAYADLQKSIGLHLMTYDNLVTRHQNFPGRAKNVVRLTYPGPTFSYAYLNAAPRSEFAYLGPGRLTLDADSREVIVSLGYDIDAWENGELLIVNNKYPRGFLASNVKT